MDCGTCQYAGRFILSAHILKILFFLNIRKIKAANEIETRKVNTVITLKFGRPRDEMARERGNCDSSSKDIVIS